VQPYLGGEERTEAEVRLDGEGAGGDRTGLGLDVAGVPAGRRADRNDPVAHVTDENADLADGFPPVMVVTGDRWPAVGRRAVEEGECGWWSSRTPLTCSFSSPSSMTTVHVGINPQHTFSIFGSLY
jgi:hypothetical protein